jgi:dihydrofolate reductase
VIVSAIAAIGENGVLGCEGKLPWHLPDDLKRFRATTWGKPIIMGRKTFESLGRALPGRTNIVLTRTSSYRAEGCTVVSSPAEALSLAAAGGADEVFVIGGSEVFRLLLPQCNKVYLTVVEGAFEGDAFFPTTQLDSSDWLLVHEERHSADARNPLGTTYRILERWIRVDAMRDDGLLPVDALVKEFSEALSRGVGAFFIGSGISRNSDVPSWRDLLDPLAKTRLSLDLGEQDDLSEVAQYVLNRDGGNRGALIYGFIESLRRDYQPNRLHQSLARSNVSTIWTTNYDTLIERAFTHEDVDVKASDDAISRSTGTRRVEVVKMHGCISRSRQEELVITQEDYEDYPLNRPATTERLRSDLLQKSFLFAGYSYRDPNVRNVFVEARRLAGKATRTHYLITKRIDESDVAGWRRQLLWCQNLRRLGIETTLINNHDDLGSIFDRISIKSRGHTVFVTGSHKQKDKDSKLVRDLGKLLAQEGSPDVSNPIILIDGQSSGVNHHCVAAYSEEMVVGKREVEGRIRVFPNPYAANPTFSGDPSLIPLLKRWRAPLFRSTHVLVVFDGAMGTKAEVEVARDLGCRIIPVALRKEGLAYELLNEPSGEPSLIAQDLEPRYLAKLGTGELTAKDIMRCICKLLSD